MFIIEYLNKQYSIKNICDLWFNPILLSPIVWYMYIYIVCVCINEIENLKNNRQKLLQLAIFGISGLGEKFVNHCILLYCWNFLLIVHFSLL